MVAGRTDLKAIKKEFGKAAVKASLRASKNGQIRLTKARYVRLLLASEAELNNKHVSKYAGIIEHVMENENGKAVSDFVRDIGGIKKADEFLRRNNKRRR